MGGKFLVIYISNAIGKNSGILGQLWERKENKRCKKKILRDFLNKRKIEIDGETDIQKENWKKKEIIRRF